MISIHPLILKDFYKTDHRSQYPKDTNLIYSNFTPRKSRVTGVDKMVVFGIQYLIKEYLQNQFSLGFFNLKKDEAIAPYRRRLDTSLGKNSINMDHVADLWDLGYLPLRIKALPEGSLVNMGIPIMTCENTHPDFAWVVNSLETLESTTIWGPCTSATTAFEYLKLFRKYAKSTNADLTFTAFQGHDFSARGMFGVEAGAMSGAGQLLSFFGTDTIYAIDFLENYYGANAENELIGTSVPATEHSVMCMEGMEGEFGIYQRLLTETYPTGIVSVVSDTYNLWNVVTNFLPKLKDIILARGPNGPLPGKLVLRPDSGDPSDILCGNNDADSDEPARKGLIAWLWDIFGGTIDKNGFKHLDPHIGAIYGDSITLPLAKEILQRLAEKKFATDCVVLGIGSYSFQYVTRDSFGTAMKATYAEVAGKSRNLFKDPITDNGKAAKKSAKGLLKVTYDAASKNYTLHQEVTREDEGKGELKLIFENGKLLIDQSLAQIRARIQSHLE